MTTTLEPTVDLELLRKFCGAEHPDFCDVFNVWNYRGGSWVNYDLCATNGKVLLCVHKYEQPDAKEKSIGLPTDCWWAMSAIADGDPEVRPAKDKTLIRVSEEIHRQLKALPMLEFKEVPKVKIWSHGRGKPKQKFQNVDDDAFVFFKFTGGVGCCVAASKSAKASNREGGGGGGSEPAFNGQGLASSHGSPSLGEITPARRNGNGAGGVFFGLPRCLPGAQGRKPFARAASAFASEVARPPRRPSACAALFIGEGDATVIGRIVVARAAVQSNVAVERLVGPVGLVVQFRDDAAAGCAFRGALHGRASQGGRGNKSAVQHGSERESVSFGFDRGVVFHNEGDVIEPLGYNKGKVKILLGGGGGSENLPSALAKKNAESSNGAGGASK